MSQVINNTVLKRINSNYNDFPKEELVKYINQIHGQVSYLQEHVKDAEERETHWYVRCCELYDKRSEFKAKSIFSRIILAIRKDIL
jgi:hypothetical protein